LVERRLKEFRKSLSEREHPAVSEKKVQTREGGVRRKVEAAHSA